MDFAYKEMQAIGQPKFFKFQESNQFILPNGCTGPDNCQWLPGFSPRMPRWGYKLPTGLDRLDGILSNIFLRQARRKCNHSAPHKVSWP
jgi:hypothetical protein